MSSEYNCQTAVVESHAGQKAKENIEWFKYPKVMVYDLPKAYEASDDKENFRSEYKTHKKCSGAIRTPEFVADVVKIVKENPSIRKIAKEMGTSRETIGHTVKEDLNFKSYKLRRHQLLTQVQKERRKLKVSALIDLKHTSSGMLGFFSDEKIFVQDMKPNQWNNR